MKWRQRMRQMRSDVNPGTLRYLNEWVRQRCSVDMLQLGLFPDMKEITESFGAYAAARDHLGYALADPSVAVVAVGDGHTPRTAATFAFRSAWTCHSVDPRVTEKRKAWPEINRLTVHPVKVEDWRLDHDGPVIIVAVHSHADLPAAVESVSAPEVAVVAVPCCVPQALSTQPDIEYDDPSIWSAKRTVKVWKSVLDLSSSSSDRGVR